VVTAFPRFSVRRETLSDPSMARLAPNGYQKLPSAPLRRLVQNMILVQRAPEQMIVRGVLRKRPVLLSQMCSARIAAAQFLMCRARQALSG
jgi:hypothetical protein